MNSIQNKKSKTEYGVKLYSLAKQNQKKSNKKFRTFFSEKKKPTSTKTRKKYSLMIEEEKGLNKVSLYRKLSEVRAHS